jgi:hypothetical protein
MTEYGLQPSYIRLDYSSSYGPHSSTIPTTQWLPTSITGAMGSYVGWNTVPIDAEDMIDGYVALAKALIPPTSSFNFATVFNFDSGPANRFIPVASKALSVVGTSATGSPNKAVSFTMNMRTEGGQPFKVVYLDFYLATEFNKITAGGFSVAMLAVANYLGDSANAFSGRDNTRPSAIVSGTFDLNDALRKQYRMI